jgi:hypothetical protein
MSERSERIIVAAPKAHWCTTQSVNVDAARETLVHQ